MNRFYQGDWMDSMASRFVDELPDEFIKKNNNYNNEEENDFDFNQDIEFESEVRSQMDKIPKIKMINHIKNL